MIRALSVSAVLALRFAAIVSLILGMAAPAVASPRIELADLLEAFMISASSPANVPSWSVGATEDSPPAIVWETRGLADDPHGEFTRHGKAVVSIDGAVEEQLETRVVPVAWSIDLYGPHAGPFDIEFDPGLLVHHEPPNIQRYLKAHGFTVLPVHCFSDGGFRNHEALYSIRSHGRQSATLYEFVSCGAAACGYRYALGFPEPASLDVFRNAAKLRPAPREECVSR
jgi:hypothetical protein